MARIDAYLVAKRIDVCSIASYLGISNIPDRPLVLSTELPSIVRSSSEGKYAVLYPFGAIALVDHSNTGIRHILHFLTSMGVDIDESFFATYSDDYAVCLEPDSSPSITGECARVPKDFAQYLICTCDVMVKSLLFERIEDRVNELSDIGEELVDRSGRGRFFYMQRHIKQFAMMMRVQSDYAAAYDKQAWAMRSSDEVQRSYSKELEDFYDLTTRKQILDKKSADLDALISTFTEYSVHRQEYRLYMVEVVLLFSFVILDLVRFFE